MKTWTQLALMAVAAGGLLLVSFAYSRQLGSDLLARAEIDALERIPVLPDKD